MKDAEAVQNVARLIRDVKDQDLLVVQSAMGKMTNHLELLWQDWIEGRSTTAKYQAFVNYHREIADQLSMTEQSWEPVKALLDELRDILRSQPGSNEALTYDRIVAYGELVGTRLTAEVIRAEGVPVEWLDIRHVLVTDSTHRSAVIDWERSRQSAEVLQAHFETAEQTILLTQGFIARSRMGNTTTLGREGSDYTAAILAFLLDANEVTIWKDVPGMLNADPKWFQNTLEVPELSYREAIELSYYGASVIHSKTIKPLQNKAIPLYVRSFVDPLHKGTVIRSNARPPKLVPMYIFKPNQVLVSISPRDFSFIVEHNLRDIFDALNACRLSVNLMQNSAISFSVCLDQDHKKLEALMELLKENYEVRYNEGVELLTIRHYDEKIVRDLTAKKELLVEQRSRQMLRMVLRDSER